MQKCAVLCKALCCPRQKNHGYNVGFNKHPIHFIVTFVKQKVGMLLNKFHKTWAKPKSIVEDL